MPRYRAIVLALALIATPSAVSAQEIQVAISGFGGAAIPTADLVDVLIPQVGAFSLGHEVGFTAGGRVAVWPTSRFGIEAEGAYVGSDVKVVGILAGFAADTSISANLFIGSLNAVWAVLAPPLEPVALYLSGGIGYVSRGGDFFTGLDDTSDIAGVVGIGLRYGVGPGWRLRVDVKDYLSSFKNEALDQQLQAAGGAGSQLQNDLVLSAGVELFFTPGS